MSIHYEEEDTCVSYELYTVTNFCHLSSVIHQASHRASTLLCTHSLAARAAAGAGRAGVERGGGDEATKKAARALLAQPSKLQREKKKQARHLVYFPGMDQDITIGKLTREVLV